MLCVCVWCIFREWKTDCEHFGILLHRWTNIFFFFCVFCFVVGIFSQFFFQDPKSLICFSLFFKILIRFIFSCVVPDISSDFNLFFILIKNFLVNICCFAQITKKNNNNNNITDIGKYLEKKIYRKNVCENR